MVPLDPGIAHIVKILQAAGVHTYESCQGGPGHTYQHPTVRFYGSTGEGWRALGVCMDHGLPVMNLQRSWDHDDGEPAGPYWQIVFRPDLAHGDAGLAAPVAASAGPPVLRRDLAARWAVAVVVIDVWIRRVARVVRRHLGHDWSLPPGAGPADPPRSTGRYASTAMPSTPSAPYLTQEGDG